MKKWYFILSLLALTILPALAADWVEIYYKMYIDSSSHEYNLKTKVARIWIKALNSEGYNIENINGKKVWYELKYQEFDCAKKQTLMLSSTYYDLQGRVLDSYENPYINASESLRQRSYSTIVPDSIGELLYETACYPYL
ncbi:MAG: hypothetical protein LBJ74_00525 [Heliobacteriaceae bacterium]|nr:hypothetical protein [Heliobacteriaceae bacterium]